MNVTPVLVAARTAAPAPLMERCQSTCSACPEEGWAAPPGRLSRHAHIRATVGWLVVTESWVSESFLPHLTTPPPCQPCSKGLGTMWQRTK